MKMADNRNSLKNCSLFSSFIVELGAEEKKNQAYEKQGGEENSFSETYLEGTRDVSFLSVSIPGKCEHNNPRRI